MRDPRTERDRQWSRAVPIGLAAVSIAAVIWTGMLAAPGRAQERSTPGEGQARGVESVQEYRDAGSHPAYFEAGPFVDGYAFTELPLDPESRFYPSSATTASGDYYSQVKLMDVERCGDAGCHPDIYAMWYESTHHLGSFNDPWYQRTFRFFEERSGQEPARWCAGCHDPAIMMTGKMRGVEPIDFESAGANVGITCQFCHSVGRIHPAHANGSYVLAPSFPLPHEGTQDPELRRLGNQELLSDPDLITRHKSDRRKPFLLFGEFCGTCHKQSLITPANNYKWLRGFDEFDGWQNSGVSGFSARSFYYPDRPMTCQNCHMPEVPSDDAGNDDGLVNSHRFLAANTALSSFHGYDDQLKATAEFLRDDQVSVRIFALRGVPDDGAMASLDEELVAPVDAFRVSTTPGRVLELDVVVRTRGVGHMFPGGTVDSNMVWLEVLVTDANGTPVAMSGGMDEDAFVDRDAHFYRGLFLDEAGQELIKRNGWDRRAAVYVRMIPPGSADTVHYRFRVPNGVDGPLKVRARLNYRKHKQSYNRWVFGAEPAAEQPDGAVSTPAVDTRAWVYDDSLVPELPTVVMAEDEVEIGLLDEGGGGLLSVDGVESGRDRIDTDPQHWMGFNDWGIGLLRQADLRGALRAFRVVQALRDDYADAWINEARVHLREGSIDEARTALERALEIEPGFFKAEYFLSRVEAAYGRYDRAIELLERVKASFPYDRQIRLDLGRYHYRTGAYERAVEDLLVALEIDPEERAAHYTLMLTYQAMGEEEKAYVHETRYRRYREDEDIRALTGPFRRSDPAANRESLPIHIHDLTPPAGRFSAADRFPIEEFLDGGRFDRPPTVFPGPAAPWLRQAGGGGGR